MVWQEVIENSNVWIYEYVANGYRANAIALPLSNDALAIVSPPLDFLKRISPRSMPKEKLQH
ncbi:MAG: hypothetical protein HC780_28940 [Leptolyngbyaceae cyanobacterium CSU_1_3]|nr:hypothetical protein [Leptolyngbyaceae cyanobacterium CSU_1_3]